MAASEHAQPISRRVDALAVVRKLVDAGHVAYFAGGCVRDALLGLDPKDYDVATTATPDVARALFPRSQGVGQAFGVLLVREGPSQIELATFRADGEYSDGRRPDDVRFAGPEEDARRRDFTINGLFHDPLADRIIDFVDGVADLKSRTLRAIGDPSHRFAEDYLRLLRAIRFAARFDLSIDPPTRDAITRYADRLPRIAPERIADELRAMFAPTTRRVAKKLLDAVGLTDVLLRHAIGDTAAPSASAEIFEAACDGPETSFALALATMTIEGLLQRSRDVDELLTPESARHVERSLRTTLRLSNETSDAVRNILAVDRLLGPAPPSVATMKRFLAGPDSSDARRLLHGLASVGLHAVRVAWLEDQFTRFDPSTIAPPPLVNGNDLQQAGHRPGPRFKPALDAAYDAQLEGRVESAPHALAIAIASLAERPARLLP